MVKEKTGRAMQEKERERKGKNGKIIKVAGCSPIREGVLPVSYTHLISIVYGLCLYPDIWPVPQMRNAYSTKKHQGGKISHTE